MAEDTEGFTFQGAIAAKTVDATKITANEKATSTTSALAALIWAYAWIYAQAGTRPTIPPVTVHTDSLVAKGLASGQYNSTHHREFTTITRVLHDLASTAVDLRTDHVKAHAGHPWDELADSLA